MAPMSSEEGLQVGLMPTLAGERCGGKALVVGSENQGAGRWQAVSVV